MINMFSSTHIRASGAIENLTYHCEVPGFGRTFALSALSDPLSVYIIATDPAELRELALRLIDLADEWVDETGPSVQAVS